MKKLYVIIICQRDLHKIIFLLLESDDHLRKNMRIYIAKSNIHKMEIFGNAKPVVVIKILLIVALLSKV